ncbi:MAG: hypothetical protein JWO36_5991 [Myxococcales bacterium]|nr:hypothetical protein [Myxococcales bacterium]
MKRLFLPCLFLFACGDDLKAIAPDAHGAVDAPQLTDALVHRSRAVVVAPPVNFGPPPGSLSTIDIATLEVRQNVVAGVVGADPYLRSYGGKLFIINRSTGNNITILDGKTLAFEEQLGTGASSNPQDVAVKGQKLYVPGLGTTGVVVLTRGSSTFTTIDLGTALGDPDGKPDCVSAYLVGNDLFVACDLLDTSFVPRGNGKVAVIDTTNDTFKTSVTLPYKNPQGMFVRTPTDSMLFGDLLIPTAPYYGDLTQGCLARVSVGATPAASCAITNAAVGGYETHVDVQVVDGAEMLWMAVSTSFTAGDLRAYDLKTGSLWAMPVNAAMQQITDVAGCPDGSVVATDAKMNAAGFRVYKDGVEKTTAAISIGLPPGFGNGLICADK